MQAFQVLPSDPRAQQLLDREYVWCLIHMMLDQEEQLAALCPSCQQEVQRTLCPRCGIPQQEVEGTYNPHFDLQRYHAMARGDKV